MFLNVSVLNTLNIFTDLKGTKKNIICTMDDVRGDFHFDEYLRSYSMPTMGILKVINNTMRMRKH